jgi:spermidine/putrescine transport system ATP-binding protein
MTDIHVAVAISNVKKTYTGASKPALQGVSLDILENEFFTLLGPSGCGKTTLLRMIGGFEHPDSGTISLNGVLTGTTPPNRRLVNTVFQSYALFPHMTVEQNIAFALEMLNRPRDSIRERVAEMMRLVQLDHMGDRKPGQLSGGQQQRVALGRALAPAPKVLLLDEPLSALDHKLRTEMQGELKRLQSATGITFIFVTHDQEEALTMSNRIAVMDHGQVMQVGKPTEIYDQPANRFVAEFIGDTNFLSATCVQREGPSGQFCVAAGGGVSTVLLLVNDAGSAQSGDSVVLAIRPERVKVTDFDSAAFRGTLQESTYNGSDVILRAALADGTVLRARVTSEYLAGLPLNAAIGFTIPPDAIRVFKV